MRLKLNKTSCVWLAAVTLLVLPQLAHADGICVVVDTTQDNLSASDQKATRTLLLSAFESEKLTVDRTGKACTESYTLYHVKLGKSINITISGPKGTRHDRTHNLEELPLHYSQIVRSLISGKPITSSSNAITRKNVDTDKMVPRRAAADSLWYIRLGYAGILAKGFQGGPSIGFGYRFELDNLGVDVSFLNMVIAVDESNGAEDPIDDDGGITGSWIRLMALYFIDPLSSTTPFAGGGLSWGGSTIVDGLDRYRKTGMQVEIAAGYEFLRASTIRMTTGIEITLPLYMAEHSGGLKDDVYTPTVALTFGVGWGKSNTLRVVH
jgi:hypothetical protein